MPETLTKESTSQHTEDASEKERSDAEKKEVMQARIENIRAQVMSFISETYYELGAAGSEETEMLEKGLAHIKADDEKDVKGWEDYVRGEMQRQKQFAYKLHENLMEQLNGAVQRGDMTESAKKRWIDRFRDPNANYKRKEYFVKNELPRRIENLKEMLDRRDALMRKSNIKSVTHLPEYALMTNMEKFTELKYQEKKHIISLLETLLENPEKNEKYTKIAHEKLTAAARDGYLSSNKVGSWMKRIFEEHHSAKDIEAFLKGNGANSLAGIILNWKNVTKRFNDIDAVLGKSENIARGFRRVPRKEFLEMHYDQRVSYVNEAERVLETSKNIDKENPHLLKIRHYLDIEDWDAADDEIREAQKSNLNGPDLQRLHSMRDYLKTHRKDGGVTLDENMNMEAILAAQAAIDTTLENMDSGLANLAERLLRHGNMAINNLRWTLYNYVWCNKNGFIDQAKAQERASTYKDVTKERYENQEDVGTNDVAIDDGYLRNDEHIKQAMKQGRGQKATYQISNVENPNVISSLENYYSKSHDTQVLYWETFVATDSAGNAKSDAWHQQQFTALNELRTHTRTLENAGLRWRGRGISLRSISQNAPAVEELSIAG